MESPSLLAPILSGAFAFAGVLLAQTVLLWTHKRKVVDEDMRRWQAERRTLYASFVSESERIASMIDRAHSTSDLSVLPNIHDQDEYKVEAILNEVMLIGSPQVVVAAQELASRTFIDLLGTWKWVIGDGTEDDQSDLSTMDEETREGYRRPQRMARVQFLREARNELMNPSNAKPEDEFVLFPGLDR